MIPKRTPAPSGSRISRHPKERSESPIELWQPCQVRREMYPHTPPRLGTSAPALAVLGECFAGQKPAKRASPGQLRMRAPTIIIAIIPKAIRRSKVSLNANHASSTVNNPSAFSTLQCARVISALPAQRHEKPYCALKMLRPALSLLRQAQITPRNKNSNRS